jgi:spore coat polysaccharide biosynthesis protein SpsF
MTLGRTGIIVAGRTGSQRLPGKALLPLNGVPMISFLLRRLQPARLATLLFATTTLPADDELVRVVGAESVPVFRGANDDVVARYVAAAEHFGLETVVRVTADCPFVNAELVDYCIEYLGRWRSFDLVTTKTRFPVGLDAEIYRAESMSQLHRADVLSSAEREHLTLRYYNHSDTYQVRYVDPIEPWVLPGAHFTVDTPADYERASGTAAALPAGDLSLAAVVRAATAHLPSA